jgi:hypothetical protein
LEENLSLFSFAKYKIRLNQKPVAQAFLFVFLELSLQFSRYFYRLSVKNNYNNFSAPTCPTLQTLKKEAQVKQTKHQFVL